MKIFAKALAVVLVLVMALSLVPALEAPASAAATPILVLSSTTAVNPILDHTLTPDLFATGGPFTVTFDWKADGIKDNDATDVGAAHGFVGVTGTIYGTLNNQANTGLSIKGTTNWESKSFQFQNVGTYPMSGTNIAGNILRFGLWKAKGSLLIKNLIIKNAAGTVLYNLNTDSVVSQAVSQTQANGLTECDMSELAAIDYANCPWNAGQFSTGNYTSSIRFEAGSGSDTTSSSTVTRPPVTSSTTASTTKQTTASTTKQTTASTTKQTTASTTKATTISTTKPTTTRPTTVSTQPGAQDPCAKGHSYQNGYCKYCGVSDPNYNPCANGHTFQEGWCMICLAQDPTYDRCADKGHTYQNNFCIYCAAQDPNSITTSTTTAATTTQATVPTTAAPNNTQNTQNNGGLDPVWLIVFVMVFAVGICVVVLYATGAFSKKKD